MNTSFHALGETILQEVSAVVEKIDEGEAMDLAGAVAAAGRVFVTGEGRTGLLVRAHAVRLIQIGLQAYDLGDAMAPRIGRGDVLIAVSGSGETATTIVSAEAGRAAHAAIWAVTATRGSRLAQLADRTLCIPGQTKEKLEGQTRSVQPLSNLFGQALLIVLDAIGLQVMHLRDETNETMRERHGAL